MKLNPENLHIVCGPADFFNTKKNLDTAHLLLRLMAKKGGIGLAANQCGLDTRLFVMHVSGRFYHCFNPEILQTSGPIIEGLEGCLSFTGKRCLVPRHENIFVKYYSAEGTAVEEWLTGLTARCFQHELDHLNGVTMFQSGVETTPPN